MDEPMRRNLLLQPLFFLLISPVSLMSQQKSSIEPLRTAEGVMTETRIVIRRSNWINDAKPIYEYRLASAWITDGKLVFTGSLRPWNGRKADVVKATLISTTARSANPWPGANSPTARERRTPAQRERGAAEVNEQTQSLYSAAEAGSGCELIHLKMPVPGQARPLQVGVALAHKDNDWGVKINQAICRLVRTMNANEKTDDALEKLNRLISRE